MRLSINNWTIGRRITAGFAATTMIAAMVIATFEYGINELDARHEEVKVDSDAALDIAEAASSAAELYRIVADAQINLNLQAAKGDWAAMRKTTEERLAAVESQLHTDTQRALLSDARQHYASMATLFEQELLPMLQRDQALSDRTRQLDGHVDEQASGMAENLEALRDQLVKESESATARFSARQASTNRLVLLMAIVGVLLTIGVGTLVVMRVSRRLRTAVASLTEGSQQLLSASEQVAGSAQSLSQGATEQAASLEETSASMEEMASMTRRNAESARQATRLVTDVHDRVDESQTALRDMVQSMAAIRDCSQRVSKIIRTIDEIAFQTNILALNAAVEAARAGEAGMGFAVVADEVRNLAQRSAQAAKDTADLIEESTAKVQNGSEKVSHVTEAIRGITESVNRVKSLVQEVSDASTQQTQGFDHIAQALSQMEKVTQSTAATAEESAASSEELSAQAATTMEVVAALQTLVGGLKDGSRAPVAGPRSARGRGRALLHMPKRSATAMSQRPEDLLPLEKTGTFGSF